MYSVTIQFSDCDLEHCFTLDASEKERIIKTFISGNKSITLEDPDDWTVYYYNTNNITYISVEGEGD